MHVTTQCVHCGQSLQAPRELEGKLVRCSGCRQQFVLSLAAAAPSPARAPAPRRCRRATRC